MEYPNNQQSLRPSKRFLLRGGIASGIILLILVVQTQWFAHLFSKKGSAQTGSTATIAEVVGKDSNGNGIADWEERLWGLDPTVTTTNGVSNKVIIEEKRKSLQTTDTTNGPLNETDRLAQQLFGFTTALGGEGAVNTQSLNAMASKLGSQNVAPNTVPTYTLKNIKTVSTTKKSLSSYQQSLSTLLSSYDTNTPEIGVFITSIENGDYSSLDSLDTTITSYTSLSKKLLTVPAPIGVAQYHLDITNSIIGIAHSFEKMKSVGDNGINALVGLSEYRYNEEVLSKASENLSTYLQQYGILQQ